jgi:hypothetical protein
VRKRYLLLGLFFVFLGLLGLTIAGANRAPFREEPIYSTILVWAGALILFARHYEPN